MGPFSFLSPDPPEVVLARLRAEGRRWRPADVCPEVRAAGAALAVRVEHHRFRLWMSGGRAAVPVAAGDVVPAGSGARVAGRVRHSHPQVVWLAVWTAGAAYLGLNAGWVWFDLWLLVVWAGGVFASLRYAAALREDALLAVLAAAAEGTPAPAPATCRAASGPPSPNEALQLPGTPGHLATPLGITSPRL